MSRSGALAVTSTRSEIAPTSSVSFRVSDWPTDSVMPLWVRPLKPAMSTVTRYGPACSSGASK